MTSLVEFKLAGQMPEGRQIEQMEEIQLMFSKDGQELVGLLWERPDSPTYALLPVGRYSLDLYWQIGAEIWKLDEPQAFEAPDEYEHFVTVDLTKSHIDDVSGGP